MDVLVIIALVLSAVTAVTGVLLVLYVRQQQKAIQVDARTRHVAQSKKVNDKLAEYETTVKSVESVGSALMEMQQSIQQLQADVEVLQFQKQQAEAERDYRGFARAV